MASNHTTNYQLCQWQADDQVKRTDFNEDNAKIDAALNDLSGGLAEKADQAALDALAVGRTTLIIAHRLSTIRSAGRILVIDGCGIAEEGTHAQLLAKGGEYARLYAAQSGGTEEG